MSAVFLTKKLLPWAGLPWRLSGCTQGHQISIWSGPLWKESSTCFRRAPSHRSIVRQTSKWSTTWTTDCLRRMSFTPEQTLGRCSQGP
uniref:Putative secreted protein n=1 Tax=Ixodes ricinus TaxID=34613 RepID=A0A6B0TZT9_IXORI